VTAIRQPLARTDWSLALGWILATTLGWVVGFAICEALKSFLESLSADGAVIGISIGISQWFVLRRRIDRAAWWIPASIVGFAIGKFGADAVVQAETGIGGVVLSGFAIGIAAGFAQWVVLVRHVSRAELWVVASALGWAVGWTVINTVDETIGGPTVAAYVIGAAGAAAAGVITGMALVWLLRSPSPLDGPSGGSAA
jgi:hypothetical protein